MCIVIVFYMHTLDSYWDTSTWMPSLYFRNPSRFIHFNTDLIFFSTGIFDFTLTGIKGLDLIICFPFEHNLFSCQTWHPQTSNFLLQKPYPLRHMAWLKLCFPWFWSKVCGLDEEFQCGKALQQIQKWPSLFPCMLKSTLCPCKNLVYSNTE